MTFRNPFSRQHHSIKKAAISKTVEREFEREVRKLEQLDEDTKKICKDSKRCIDCQSAQARTENKIVHNLYNSPVSRENQELRYVSDMWFQGVQQLDLLSQEMNAAYGKTVAEPMKKFGSAFPSLTQHMKKREQALQELNKSQAKVDKYAERDRTGPNIVKLDASKKAMASTKSEFDAHHQTLMDDMPKLYEGRIDYFEPSFQGLVKSQLKYYTEAHKIYTTLAGCLNTDVSPEFSNPFSDGEEDENTQENTKLQQKLAEIRALSITVDD